ncbi:MAG: amidohydrolase [Flavobacteriales bacterium]|nr:amidohydrolase [Flavobacteriales bacterium]
MTIDLNITLVQKDLVWENPEANRSQIDRLIDAVDNTDLVILPEMFTTGFTMNSEKLSETMEGPTVTWMKNKALETGAAICGSLIINDDAYYNRMVFAKPDGTLEHYDKRHLFRMAGETEYFSAGKKRKILRYKGWNIALQVCYDLRFPVFSRNAFHKGNWEYDLLIYVANWPSPRASAWQTLTKARAHENQCYVAAVNRVGKDGSGLTYDGNSSVVSAKGEHLLTFNKGEENIKSVSVSFTDLLAFRKKFPIGEDTDDFIIQI